MQLKALFRITIVFLCFSVQSIAQSDFGLWTGLELNVPITKDIKFGLESQARFDNNVSRTKEAFISPYVKWDMKKYFRVGVNYRLSSVPYNSTVLNRVFSHRYTLDLEFRNILDLFSNKNKIKLAMRLRATNEHEREKLNKNYLRYKIKADYNLPKTKLEPSLSAEFFYHFNDQIVYTFNEVKTFNRINKFRLRLGFEYPLSKKHTINIFSIYQHQIAGADHSFIIGAGYSFSMRNPLINKKD